MVITMAPSAAPFPAPEDASMTGKHSLHDIEEAEKKPLWQRLGWLAMIWVGSVGALFIVASLMRMFMNAAGLTTH
ncbi:hypothetical protein QS95_23455 [Pseudomonas fluorescens]|nr:hypothetical protein QS95_23455 [Pseudomonas fluorescens]